MDNLGSFFSRNRGGILGAAAGVVMALLLTRFGLFQVVFVLICGFVGYVIGTGGTGDDRINSQLRTYIYDNKGKIIGTLAGIALALFFLNFGFLKAIFIIALAIIGFYFGAKRENREQVKTLFENLFHNKE